MSSGAQDFRTIQVYHQVHSTTFGGVELKKGFPNFACREFDSGHCNGGCRIERRLGPLVISIRIGSKD